MKLLYAVFLFVYFSSVLFAQYKGEFIKGGDISYIPQVENGGGIYYENGEPKDPILIFKNNEMNYFRLRIWHTPTGPLAGYCNLEKTLYMAKRIKEQNLGLILDFHYSDTWADPGKQLKPAAWEGIDFEELKDSLYQYTFRVITKLKEQNTLPEIVQIGNEINTGILWPDGQVGGSYETDIQWDNFTNLLKTAINASKDAAGEDTVKIMIHIAEGGSNNISRWFLSNILERDVQFDIFGLSFYPWWHGTLTQLQNNLNNLAVSYNKNLLIAETAYPWTLDYYDNVGNIVGSDDDLHPGYPASVSGQMSFLRDLIQIVKDVPNNRGKGVLYWAPENISAPNYGSVCENLALFNFQGEALSSFIAFHEPDTSEGISVTFRLNTALHPDTISISSFVQLRGEVVEYGQNYTLPGGKRLSWDVSSEIILQNVEGDYWETTVKAIPNTTIQYKYWTGSDINTPTFVRLGWEGPIEPVDGSGGNYRVLELGDEDTVMNIEFYNPSGLKYDQYWKPYDSYEDSIAVLFRVNMAVMTASGKFNPDVDGPVGVRGDDKLNNNILSRNETKVFLEREQYSFEDGSFWSGTAYFPKNEIDSGTQIEYNFYIENSSNNHEESIPARTFSFPSSDTTLNWCYFNDQKIVTDINEEELPKKIFIFQNYPNPFNPSTTIIYKLDGTHYITISIYNSLGEKVKALFSGIRNQGPHEIIWNGKSDNGIELSSGIYFAQLSAGKYKQTIKMLLLR